MTYAVKHHARRFTITSLLLTGLILASSGLSHAQQPATDPVLDFSNETKPAKPRESNSVGMTLALLDAAVFQMGSPEYIVEVVQGGGQFPSLSLINRAFHPFAKHGRLPPSPQRRREYALRLASHADYRRTSLIVGG